MACKLDAGCGVPGSGQEKTGGICEPPVSYISIPSAVRSGRNFAGQPQTWNSTTPDPLPNRAIVYFSMSMR